MKLSKLIRELNRLHSIWGDIDVRNEYGDGPKLLVVGEVTSYTYQDSIDDFIAVVTEETTLEIT